MALLGITRHYQVSSGITKYHQVLGVLPELLPAIASYCQELLLGISRDYKDNFWAIFLISRPNWSTTQHSELITLTCSWHELTCFWCDLTLFWCELTYFLSKFTCFWCELTWFWCESTCFLFQFTCFWCDHLIQSGPSKASYSAPLACILPARGANFCTS